MAHPIFCNTQFIFTLDQSVDGIFSKVRMKSVVPSKVTTAFGVQEWSTIEAAKYNPVPTERSSWSQMLNEFTHI